MSLSLQALLLLLELLVDFLPDFSLSLLLLLRVLVISGLQSEKNAIAALIGVCCGGHCRLTLFTGGCNRVPPKSAVFHTVRDLDLFCDLCIFLWIKC